MSRCWIGIAAAEHVAIAVASGFAMFSHGRRSAIDKVAPGDWAAYYSPRQGMDDGAEVRAFTAIGRVLQGEPVERNMTSEHTGWSRPVRWLEAAPADIYPLLDRFSFVKNRSHWGMYFRKSLFEVEPSDFGLIAGAMGVGNEFRQPAES